MKSLTEIIGIDKKGVERNVFDELDTLKKSEPLYENVYMITDTEKEISNCTFTLVEEVDYTGANVSTLYQHLNGFLGLRKECNGITRSGFVSCLIEINPTGEDSGWYLHGFRGGGAAPSQLYYRKKQIDTRLIGNPITGVTDLIPDGLACIGRRIR